ncbi:hypothetical protein DEO72_LG4g2400 [Vigna unguiculata]|uniref:Uncharacterized protein n=1 Tax=Vigna unguiculata TaxID=3917 RepID=A0A4D6LSC0_VIGUN|nr:hypothetical protein DEO72_LG4g2400 [Vigna unguiculata]
MGESGFIVVRGPESCPSIVHSLCSGPSSLHSFILSVVVPLLVDSLKEGVVSNYLISSPSGTSVNPGVVSNYLISSPSGTSVNPG